MDETKEEKIRKLKSERIRMIEEQKKALITEIARTQAIVHCSYPKITREDFRDAHEYFLKIPHEKWTTITRDLHEWNLKNKDKERGEISPIIIQPKRFFTSYIKGTFREKVMEMNIDELEMILEIVMERIEELDEEKKMESKDESIKGRTDMIEMD